jgi:hypothetical protein
MSLDTLLDQMVEHLKPPTLPALKTCEQVGGRIDLAEMLRRSKTLPGGFLALMGTRDGKLQNQKLKVTGQFLLVLVVSSKAAEGILPADRTKAINRLLSQALVVVASAKNWGSDEVEGPPTKIASVNPYTKSADGNNLALYGLTWEQELALVADPAPSPLDDFLYMDEQIQAVPSNPEIDAAEYVEVQEP